jgi:hypothetical protein
MKRVERRDYAATSPTLQCCGLVWMSSAGVRLYLVQSTSLSEHFRGANSCSRGDDISGSKPRLSTRAQFI